MAINRTTAIQSLIDKNGYNTYLEIGVFRGTNFFPIRAKKKIAIDPEFRIGGIKNFFNRVTNTTNKNAAYFEMESDRFFAEKAQSVLKDGGISISLIDGMHEYQYALRDAENVLDYLADDGVVVMHDCNPATEDANVSFQEWKDRNYAGVWNGDVWKAIMHLRSTRNDINVFVLDCDYGLGIITKGKQEKQLNFTPEEIKAFTYQDLEKNRKEWLNLKHPDYFYEYFHQLAK